MNEENAFVEAERSGNDGKDEGKFVGKDEAPLSVVGGSLLISALEKYLLNLAMGP